MEVAVVAIAAFVIQAWLERRRAADAAEREQHAAAERNVLLNRIQHPEVIPVSLPPAAAAAGGDEDAEDEEPDEWDLVGVDITRVEA